MANHKHLRTPKHYIKYFLQAIPAYLVLFIFRILPIDVASWVGGKLLELLGPLIKSNRFAIKNLSLAFPEKSEAEKKQILKGMWNNLGRTLGEFPHITRRKIFSNPKRMELVGEEIGLREYHKGKPIIIFTAHLANWEVSSLLVTQRDIAINRVYRPSNNPFVDWLIQYTRRSVKGAMIPKGFKGGRQAINALKNNEILGMLVDQKLNKGLSLPFFGVDAMTAPSVAELAYKHKATLMGSRVVRLKGARFRVTVDEPLALPDSGNHHKNVELVMREVNNIVEGWIREHPDQWLWIHRRWPKKHYQNKLKPVNSG
jgi:Kdo2-lipid IVA lauroyltransferase/acyltransferase